MGMTPQNERAWTISHMMLVTHVISCLDDAGCTCADMHQAISLGRSGKEHYGYRSTIQVFSCLLKCNWLIHLHVCMHQPIFSRLLIFDTCSSVAMSGGLSLSSDSGMCGFLSLSPAIEVHVVQLCVTNLSIFVFMSGVASIT